MGGRWEGAMQTFAALGSIQAERTAAFPAKFADNPLRALTLDSLQRRNAILDAVFYDIGVITPEETKGLAFWLAREGAILVVTPSGGDPLKLFLTTDEYFSKNDKAAAALVVAGVGSSALGAAAFARNIADALGEPVVAVVSGYGLSDVLTEALGGLFPVRRPQQPASSVRAARRCHEDVHMDRANVGGGSGRVLGSRE